MLEQQLVDYIKKARQAKQADEQTKALLAKNGWTEAEVGEAFAALAPAEAKPQVMPSTQPQPQIQPQATAPVEQPKMEIQPEIADMPAENLEPVETVQQIQPEVQYQPQPQAQAETEPVKNNAVVVGGRKTGRLALIFGLVIILLAIAGIGITLAYRIWDPLWNPFRPSPESVMLKALNNLSSIKSNNFNSDISIISGGVKMNGVDSGSFNLDLKTDGGIDAGNMLADIRSSIVASSTDAQNNKTSISLAGEGKLLKKDLYLELSKIDLGGLESLLTMMGFDSNSIKGQWFRFQLDDATQKQITQQVQSVSGFAGTSNFLGLDQNAKDAADKIVKVLLDGKVYDILQLPDVQSADGKQYHYTVSLNQKKIISVSPAIFGIFQNYYSKEYPNTPLPPTLTLASLQQNINDFFDKLGRVGFELFIGEDDNFLHQVIFNDKLDLSKLDKSYSGFVSITASTVESAINKPVQVSAPINFKDFSSITSALALKTNMQDLSGIAQAIFAINKSFTSICANGVLNPKRSNLVALGQNITSNGGLAPACFAGIQNYCISTQLADKSYMCMDKNGVIGTTQCVSYKTICK